MKNDNTVTQRARARTKKMEHLSKRDCSSNIFIALARKVISRASIPRVPLHLTYLPAIHIARNCVLLSGDDFFASRCARESANSLIFAGRTEKGMRGSGRKEEREIERQREREK